ncbi:MAG: triple tyrosine motif-containing protein [Bacteroidota bacterium]
MRSFSLFQDNQDNLWVGHNNGISYIELDLPFTFINEEIGLPGTGYSGYLENDHLYLGTSNGLYVKDINDAALDSYQLIPSTEGQVYEVREVDNQVLLGHHDGSFVVSPQSTSKLSDELGAWTFLPLKSRPNYMIGGTYKGLQLFKKVGNKWVYENHIEGFTESCRVLEEDADGNIWMTHGYKGVFKLTLTEDLQRVDKIAFYGSEGGLPSNILINVYNIRNEFVFTTEEDIYKYNQANDQFQPHEFYQPFFKPNDPVSVMAQDVFENVYFISKNSVGILTKNSSGEYEKTTDVFNKIKNMMNDDLQNVNILNGTYALFGAKEGFILYDHRKNNSRDYTYQTHIRQVNLTNLADSAIFNGNYFYKNTITGNQPENYVYELPYSENSLRIMFSAPFMDGLEKTEYQFKLENFDDVWSSWQNKTEKEYTNLKEGKYMFKVRAKNYFGKISSEATFDFTIMPPWYRTSLAFLSYGLVAIGFLFIAFKLLDRKHKKEKRILSIESSKQLNRKEIELKNITEQSEAEIEHLRNEKLKSEIAHKNKELATSTVHLLNKNGFIMGIKGTLSGVRKKSKNTEVKSELNRIIQDIERNISHDKDWEHFEFHFDQVHGNFSKKLKEKHPDLSPQEMKISAFLRMNLSTKEIANMLNISVRGVEISRYRLRKRLGIQRSVNLIEYLMGF